MTTTDSERATAYHEAGHAVAHFAMARRLFFVDIVPTDEYAGRTNGHELPPGGLQTSRRKRAAEDRMLIAYSGPYAEAKLTGEVDEAALAADQDFAEVMRIAELRYPDKQASRDYYIEVAARAEQIIDTLWYLVEALAAELLVSKRLSGFEVHRVLRQIIRPEAERLGLGDTMGDWKLTPLGWRLLAMKVGLWLRLDRRGPVLGQ